MYRPGVIRDNKGVIVSSEEHRKRDQEINKSIKLANDLVKKGVYQGLIIAGDFNYADIFWNEELDPVVANETESTNNFLETLNEGFLTQNVFFKTYQHDFLTLTNTLDLVITESQERVYELKSGPVLGVSSQGQGHLCINWKYCLKDGTTNFGEKFKRTKYNYKKANYVGMKSYFGSINWSDIFMDKNVGSCYEIFVNKYKIACDEFIPIVRFDKKRRIKPPWLSKELREMMRKKSNLWYAFVSSGRKSEELKIKYKEHCKLVKSSISSSISKFELELVKNHVKNPKGLFTYIKNKQNIKQKIRSLNNSRGIPTTDLSEMSEILSMQFESVFSVDDGSEPFFGNRTEFVCPEEELIIRQDIIDRLNNLNCAKAPGRDQVAQYVLKNCSEELSYALDIIFKRSLEEGEIPNEWREANITPIFKKGSKLEASNYRPVSLTSVCCKVMEGIVRTRITSHLIKYKLISPSQHGFVQKKSCVTNLLECQHIVSGLLNENKSVDVLYTDFEKAFDKVSHKKLIIKLRAYGIRGKLLEWVKGFLKGRRQCVVMGDIESEWKDILSGVPQGSVLGPLLFVIYINDLPDGLKNVFKMYADDSKVIAEAVELDQISTLQEDIAKIKEWCDKWSMCLNSGKCKVMHLGNKNPVRSYYVENGDERVPLGVTEAEKDLGIMVANNGKTKLQAEKAIHKANHELGKMRKTFRFFNIKLFRILYPTYIRPQLEFASSAWNVLSKESVNKMESIQGRATKMVFELRTLSEQDRLNALGLTTLEVRRKRGDLIQLFKIMNKMEEVDIDMGMGNSISGGVGRRHGHQIQRERTGSYPMRNFSLPNRSATTWNILPQRVVNVESVNDFKSELDEHIKSIAWRRSIYS